MGVLIPQPMVPSFIPACRMLRAAGVSTVLVRDGKRSKQHDMCTAALSLICMVQDVDR